MTRRTIEIAAFCVALLVATMAVHAWLASRDDQQRLASTLAAQKQLLDAADTRERTRQSALDDTLAQIEKLKRATQTPEEILRDLPKYLSLPQPITLTPAASSPSVAPAGKGTAPPAKRHHSRIRDGGEVERSCQSGESHGRSPPQPRPPFRTRRANSLRRSEAALRLRPGLSRVPGTARRRQAKCLGRRVQDRRA